MAENGEDVSLATPRFSLVPKLSARLGFEFVIIFLGVWGALWAENRREEVQDRENAIRIAEAMVRTIERSALRWGVGFLEERQSELAAWRESYSRGDRPVPFYFVVPGAEHGTSEIWDAAISTGILEVIDPVLASDVGAFFKEYDGLLARIGRYHVRVEESVYPGLDEGSDWFYKPGSSELKPEFAGLIHQAEDLFNQWERRNEMARARRDELAGVIAELRR